MAQRISVSSTDIVLPKNAKDIERQLKHLTAIEVSKAELAVSLQKLQNIQIAGPEVIANAVDLLKQARDALTANSKTLFEAINAVPSMRLKAHHS